MKDGDGSERLVDFGEVGDIESVDPSVLETLIHSGYVPVVASLACDESGNILNINADTVAAEVAGALNAEKLIFLTGAAGILRDPSDPESLVAFATPEDLAGLEESGAVKGGMLPKVRACIRALELGVKRTHVIDGLARASLLIELFTGSGCGTMIAKKGEMEAYKSSEIEAKGNGRS